MGVEEGGMAMFVVMVGVAQGFHLAAAPQRAPLKAGAAAERDVVVIGGGISGLSTALELRRRGRSVTVVSRDLAESATRAAGGMLAPAAERLHEGPLLDLCVQAREAWPEWASSLGGLSVRGVGGFVSPCVAEDDPIARWRVPRSAGPAEWMSGEALVAMEPSLAGGPASRHGGLWYPLEAWVDPVEAHAAVLRACENEGVEVRVGVDVAGLDLEADRCGKVRLAGGDYVLGAHVCVAAGAWLRSLLPVPVDPQKGQMLALRPTPQSPPGPSRVVYGSKAYLIPRGDRVVVGATVENVSTAHCDVRGTRALLDAAVALCPGLDEWVLDESWAGLRPTTRDGAPVLGPTRWKNLWVVGGYWRNGILIAPRAAELVADAIDGLLSKADATLLEAFAWDRFFERRRPPRLVVEEEAPFVVVDDGREEEDVGIDEGGYESIAAQQAKAGTSVDEGGYESIAARQAATMDAARAANRDLLFSGAADEQQLVAREVEDEEMEEVHEYNATAETIARVKEEIWSGAVTAREALDRDERLDVLSLIDREALADADRYFVEDYERERASQPFGNVRIDTGNGTSKHVRFKFMPPEVGLPTFGTADRLCALASRAALDAPPPPLQPQELPEDAGDDDRARADAADRLYDRVEANKGGREPYEMTIDDVYTVRWVEEGKTRDDRVVRQGTARILDLRKFLDRGVALADVFEVPAALIDDPLTVLFAKIHGGNETLVAKDPARILRAELVTTPPLGGGGDDDDDDDEFFPFVVGHKYNKPTTSSTTFRAGGGGGGGGELELMRVEWDEPTPEGGYKPRSKGITYADMVRYQQLKSDMTMDQCCQLAIMEEYEGIIETLDDTTVLEDGEDSLLQDLIAAHDPNGSTNGPPSWEVNN